MNLGTAFVLLIVVAMVALALRSTIKKKGSCGCDGGCAGCTPEKGCSCCSSLQSLETLMRES